MADEHTFRVNRSALPLMVRTLFNPEHCFARGGLTMGANGKPVLTGNCQVAQFGKNRNGNNCMFVCQVNLSDVSQQHPPVLASFVFNHMGQVNNFYYGNSDATPSWRTNVHDGTRASFGFLPPPPPPSQQYQQQPQSHAMFGLRIKDISEQLKRAKTQDDIDALVEQRTKLKQEHAAELAAAAEAAKAAAAAAKAERDAYDELIKTPRWGCTSVLKGPLQFVGCQRGDYRDPSVSLVEGFAYVPCVSASGEFDEEFDTSPEELHKITPHFKYDPVTGNSMYGASGREYYDTTSRGNVFGNKGFQSFVIRTPSGNTRVMETRQGGECTNMTSIPQHLRASFPETKEKFEFMLIKGNASLRSEMKALKWLETHPLTFPTEINSTFAGTAFDWIHELSTKFEVPRELSLSDAALTKMIKSTTKASVAAMHSPAMRASLYASLTTPPPNPHKSVINHCKCTAMDHNPRCPNAFCQFRHAMVAHLGFEWPRLRLASVEPAAMIALENEMSEATRAAIAKQQEAEAKQQAEAAKQQAADAKREERTARARELTAQRKASAAAAKASTAAARASAASSALSSSAPVVSAAPVAPASRKRKPAEAPASSAPASSAPASSAPQKQTRRKARGGAKPKTKPKSKRRLRK